MRCPLFCMAALILASGSFALCAEEAAVPAPATLEKTLTPEEADPVLDGILKCAQQIVRVEADLITTKDSQGLLKQRVVVYEALKLESPNLLWLQNRGESQTPRPAEACSLVLFDGQYLWELEERFEDEPTREATRRSVQTAGAKPAQAGLASVLSYVILGGEDVRSAADLRQRFDVEVCLERETQAEGKEVTSHHIVLRRKTDKTVIELWIEPGQALPWRVKTVEERRRIGLGASAAKPQTVIKTELRLLRNIKTNLTGLQPFPAQVFLFPVAPDIQVRDEDHQGTVLTQKQLLQDIDSVRTRILADRQQAQPVSAPETAPAVEAQQQKGETP